MPNLPEETLQWNAALAGTHSKGNETGNRRGRNQKRRGVLKWREIVHLCHGFGSLRLLYTMIPFRFYYS